MWCGAIRHQNQSSNVVERAKTCFDFEVACDAWLAKRNIWWSLVCIEWFDLIYWYCIIRGISPHARHHPWLCIQVSRALIRASILFKYLCTTLIGCVTLVCFPTLSQGLVNLVVHWERIQSLKNQDRLKSCSFFCRTINSINMTYKFIRRANSLPNCEPSIMDHRPSMKGYRRSISEMANKSLKTKGSHPSGPLIFFPADDPILEKCEERSEDSSGSDSTSSVSRNEVVITMEADSPTSNTRKMNPLKAWCRRRTPNLITGHHTWLVLHALLTILLLVLYFTRVITFPAGILAICELLFGVLVRNEIFIAALHCLVALIPCFQYEFNRMLHCIGGLHVSSAMAAFLWLLIGLSAETHGLGVRISGALLLAFIMALSLTALPVVRRRFHNAFEYVHRYAGWTSLIILLVHVVFLQTEKYTTFDFTAIINIPVFVLIAIIIIIFLPWLCVRKVFVQFQQPSKDLTVVTFPRALYPYGSTTRVSLDGREWHAFAIALTDPYSDQHSILVAAVGDWTKKLAENCRNNQLPQQIWTRRIKGLGFMYSIHAYRRVLIVCTGSGIAPALPYIKDPLPTTHTHLLWIAKQHEHQYGEYIWKLVQNKFPHVTLHDTQTQGRPGAQLVEDLFRKIDAQAVFVVSNEKFTNEVTNTLWRQGVPCFGALFDS